MKEEDESKGEWKHKEKGKEKGEKGSNASYFFSSQIKIICILPGIHQHKMCFISMIAIPK